MGSVSVVTVVTVESNSSIGYDGAERGAGSGATTRQETK